MDRWRRQLGAVLLVTALATPARSQAGKPMLIYASRASEQLAPATTDPLEVAVYLKDLNLGPDSQATPPMSAGETWWLGSPLGIWRVKCVSVGTVGATGLDGEPWRGRPGFVVRLRAEEAIQGTEWILSKARLPKQVWTERKDLMPAEMRATAPSVDGGTHRIVVDTPRGLFRLDSVFLPLSPDRRREVEEGKDGKTLVRVDISQQKRGEKAWKKLTSFETNSAVRPYLDVDGDGVPELENLEWYSETILRSFLPSLKVLAVDASGV